MKSLKGYFVKRERRIDGGKRSGEGDMQERVLLRGVGVSLPGEGCGCMDA